MESNHFFSGSTPNLINKNALESLNKIFDSNINNIETPTGEHLFKIYEEYVKPNLFALIIIAIISLFLFIRYIIKKYNETIDNDDEISNQDSDSDSDLLLIENKKNVHQNILNLNNNQNNNLNKKTTNNNNLKNQENITDSVSENYVEEDEDLLTDDKSEFDSKFTELNEEYNRAVKENQGLVSEEMLKDIYKKKRDKMTFDKLTKIIVEGGGR